MCRDKVPREILDILEYQAQKALMDTQACQAYLEQRSVPTSS